MAAVVNRVSRGLAGAGVNRDVLGGPQGLVRDAHHCARAHRHVVNRVDQGDTSVKKRFQEPCVIRCGRRAGESQTNKSLLLQGEIST